VAVYQRLRNGKPGAVIVPIRSGQCAGCHMRVSQNLINETKRGQSVNYCEHCQRIVYLEEVPAQP
jgi:predicted  nucleic acid-binding Zn-ribbon protein